MGERHGSGLARERAGPGVRMAGLLIAPPRGRDPGEGRGWGCWALGDPAPSYFAGGASVVGAGHWGGRGF